MRRQRGSGRCWQQPGTKMYTIQYYKDGKRIRESTGTSDKKLAEEKLKDRLAQLRTGAFIDPKIEKIRVSELLEEFFRSQRRDGRKGVKMANSRWKNHIEPFFGRRRATQVTTAVINEYIDERLSAGAAVATINREIALLRRMFRLGYYVTHKVAKLPMFTHLFEDNTREGFLETGQYHALVSGAHELWIRALLEVFYTTGWRKREVVNMHVSQVEFHSGVLRLPVGSTKNKKGRTAPMTPEVCALLTECARGKNPDDYLFTRADGTRVKDFRKAWRNLCVAAGLGKMICRSCEAAVTGVKCECGCKRLRYQGLIVHDMRRTVARDMNRAGNSEKVIMEIMGHKTRSMFDRYNIVDERDKREAVRKTELARQNDFGHKVGHNEAQTGASDTASAVPERDTRVN